MTIFTSVITAALFLLCIIITLLYEYHMFQLNGYKYASHFNWFKRNFKTSYLPRHIFALPCFFSVLLPGLPALILFAVCFLLQTCINRPRKAKKPLVYTPRVKRMFICNAVVLAALTAFSFSLRPGGQIVLYALTLLFSPAVVLLCNFINTPIERAINQWYINDAKRIIAGLPDLIVIGVTGSYGKTSTKYYLHKLLSAKYNVLMTPESFNTTMGVVKTIRTQLKPLHQIFICEMGAKDLGEIKEICDIVRPRHGIITSIGPQHLETFKSIENVIKTKFELADAVPQDGMVFLNYDNEYIRHHPCDKKTVGYSAEPDAQGVDYHAYDIEVSSNGSKFKMVLGGSEQVLETKLIGRHTVQNIVGAITVADRFQVDVNDIIIHVNRLESVPHRLQLINRGGLTIIDDAYNSNQNGAKAALDVLSMFKEYKILVTPGMIELGSEQDHYNFQFGVQASEVCDFIILVGRNQTQSIYNGITSRGYPQEQVLVVDDFSEAFPKIGQLKSGGFAKIVLLENDLPDNY